ncbi:MAG: hypothetical protein FWF97_01500 [Alphaproteobacteria bacterium]|nr:hypothetical protein [Alphaproteobacteria bacterium]
MTRHKYQVHNYKHLTGNTHTVKAQKYLESDMLVQEFLNDWTVYESPDKETYTLKNRSQTPIYKSETLFLLHPNLRFNNNGRYDAAERRYWNKINMSFPNTYHMLTILQDYEEDWPALIFSSGGKLLFDEMVYREAFDIDRVISVMSLGDSLSCVYEMKYEKMIGDQHKTLTGLLTGSPNREFRPIAMDLLYARVTSHYPYKFIAEDEESQSQMLWFKCESHTPLTEYDITKVFAAESDALQSAFRNAREMYKKEHCRQSY